MASFLPARSTTPSSDQFVRARLSDQINLATQKQHTVLNRAIINRLPLALPPHAATPDRLGHGLAHFADVFFQLEEAFERIAWQVRNDDFGLSSSSSHREMVTWLSELRPAGLARSVRLNNDLRSIQAITGTTLPVAKSSMLSRRLSHIANSKPHLLLAYAWVMYMATFSGGRWIRQRLSSAGPEFWLTNGDRMAHEFDARSPSKTDRFGLSFLSFDGDEDGEDIKRIFKARLSAAEDLLSAQDRREVINEAVFIFDYCIELVSKLDREMASAVVVQLFPVYRIIAILLFLIVLLLALPRTSSTKDLLLSSGIASS